MLRAAQFPIGALSAATGVNIETIRYYEKIGLMPAPPRNEGRQRIYDAGHLKRLTFVRRGRELGFSLDQIRALLALSDVRDQSCAAVDAIAKEHRAEVERKIVDLQSLKKELDRMIDQCGCGVVADCRIIESLSPQ